MRAVATSLGSETRFRENVRRRPTRPGRSARRQTYKRAETKQRLAAWRVTHTHKPKRGAECVVLPEDGYVSVGLQKLSAREQTHKSIETKSKHGCGSSGMMKNRANERASRERRAGRTGIKAVFLLTGSTDLVASKFGIGGIQFLAEGLVLLLLGNQFVFETIGVGLEGVH